MIAKVKALGVRNSHLISATSIPHNQHNIRFERITDEEFAACSTATTKCHQFVGDVQLYMAAECNYQNYCEMRAHYERADSGQLQAMIKTRALIVDINRVVLNLLASVRLYLDHTETTIKRLHGPSSQNWRSFEQACHNAYDSVFSYRFTYKLRNYAQHCGLPINHVTFTIKEHPEHPGEPYQELKFGLERDAALRGFDWGKQLNTELALQPEIIDVDQHVHPLMTAIRQINKTYAKGELEALRPEAVFIEQLGRKACYTEADYELGIYELEVDQDEQGQTRGIVGFQGSRIPMDVVSAAVTNNLDRLLAMTLPG